MDTGNVTAIYAKHPLFVCVYLKVVALMENCTARRSVIKNLRALVKYKLFLIFF